MSRRVFVSLLPSLVDASRLPGSTAVVIDVLRASTTVCAALSAGATRVVPFGTVEDAKRMSGVLHAEKPLLGGERGGRKIEGFDLGNSPLEYTRETVAGRSVLFTTTNGTRALLAVATAERVWVGAFANLSTVIRRLADVEGDVHLVCAGTDGEITLEDAIAAGSIAAALLERNGGFAIANDEATIALGLHLGYGRDETRLEAIRSGRGGANLVAIGYDRDIDFSARIDSLAVLPVYRDGALILEDRLQDSSGEAEWAI